MEKAKVFFTDFRTQLDVPQTTKLQRLIRRAGIDDIDFEGKFVAIKMHFGELGNMSYLRPGYVKAVADLIKELDFAIETVEIHDLKMNEETGEVSDIIIITYDNYHVLDKVTSTYDPVVEKVVNSIQLV